MNETVSSSNEVLLDEIVLRFLEPGDIKQVKELCLQLFPVKYPDYWYMCVTNTEDYYSLAAFQNDLILGILIAQTKRISDVNLEDRLLLENANLYSGNVGYILTLGVRKEYRRHGIATLLFNQYIEHLRLDFYTKLSSLQPKARYRSKRKKTSKNPREKSDKLDKCVSSREHSKKEYFKYTSQWDAKRDNMVHYSGIRDQNFQIDPLNRSSAFREVLDDSHRQDDQYATSDFCNSSTEHCYGFNERKIFNTGNKANKKIQCKFDTHAECYESNSNSAVELLSKVSDNNDFRYYNQEFCDYENLTNSFDKLLICGHDSSCDESLTHVSKNESVMPNSATCTVLNIDSERNNNFSDETHKSFDYDNVDEGLNRSGMSTISSSYIVEAHMLNNSVLGRLQCADGDSASAPVTAVLLHVLTTNTSAIRFYTSIDFQRQAFLPMFYIIDEKRYDAYSYVRYINGGEPPASLGFFLLPLTQTFLRLTGPLTQGSRLVLPLESIIGIKEHLSTVSSWFVQSMGRGVVNGSSGASGLLTSVVDVMGKMFSNFTAFGHRTEFSDCNC